VGGGYLQATYIIPIVLLLLIILLFHQRAKLTVAKRIIEKRKREDTAKMIELAKRFIDKECLIYSFDGAHQYEGIIKEVVDGAVLIEKNGELQAVNLDFVIRIREYPKNKKGKKKSLVLD
jgi:hypothetical protein